MKWLLYGHINPHRKVNRLHRLKWMHNIDLAKEKMIHQNKEKRDDEEVIKRSPLA